MCTFDTTGALEHHPVRLSKCVDRPKITGRTAIPPHELTDVAVEQSHGRHLTLVNARQELPCEPRPETAIWQATGEHLRHGFRPYRGWRAKLYARYRSQIEQTAAVQVFLSCVSLNIQHDQR
jgi:hypothetical protein